MLNDHFFYDKISIPGDWGDNGYLSINQRPVKNFKLAKRLLEHYELDLQNNQCPYCDKNILIFDKNFYKKPTKLSSGIDATFSVWFCLDCSFWKIEEMVGIDGLIDSGNYFETYVSKLREFDQRLPEFFKQEIAISIRRNPRMWHTINPLLFEKFVAEIFKANYCNCEVIHVGGHDDLGKDLFFIDSNNEKWIVQVKRRESASYHEPVSTIINLLGALKVEQSEKAIVVSTADRFTTSAQKLTARMEPLGCTIKLLDRGYLDRMLDGLLNDNCPAMFLKSNEKDLSNFKNNHEVEYHNTIRKLEIIIKELKNARASKLDLRLL